MHLVRHTIAVLTSRCRLQFAVVCLVNDAVATVLAPCFRLLPVAVALMQLLRNELKKLVCILLLSGNQVLKGLVFRDPKARQDISSSVAVSDLSTPEVLEHIIHSTAQAVLNLTGITGMAVAEVEISEDGIVEKTLQDDILVTGCTSIVDASKTICTARRHHCIGTDDFGIFLDRFSEQLIILSLTA